MKKSEIIGQGHCGLTIELNLMDQYAITHAVERMEEHNKINAEHEAWIRKKNGAHIWNMEKEDRAKWEAENPEPMMDHWDWEEEMLPIYTFLKKLRLPEGSEATVFNEE